MEQVFSNGNKQDSRQIMIRIDEEAIEFFFYEQFVGRQNWIEEQQEKADNYGDFLEDEDLENNGFYWINKRDWISDRTERLDREDNWHFHMKEKNWFTDEMEKFIDDNI